jgi:hypothetical protein
VILSVVKTISYKQVVSIMARSRILRDEGIESELTCDTDSDEYVEDSQSEEDEDDFADEQQPPPIQQRQNMKLGCSLKLTSLMSINIQAVTEARSRMKHRIPIKIHRRLAFSCPILHLLLICW